MNIKKTISYLSDRIEEEYCSIICDDDFLITNSLSKCAQFLSENKDYRTAQGKAILFGLNESGPYGSIKGSQVYWKNNDIIDKKNYFIGGKKYIIKNKTGIGKTNACSFSCNSNKYSLGF